MSDFLRDLVDEIGSTAAGPMWRIVRGQFHDWMDKNPVVVNRWRHAIRQAVKEGRL